MADYEPDLAVTQLTASPATAQSDTLTWSYAYFSILTLFFIVSLYLHIINDQLLQLPFYLH